MYHPEPVSVKQVQASLSQQHEERRGIRGIGPLLILKHVFIYVAKNNPSREIVGSPDFATLRNQIVGIIHEESLKASETELAAS
jgi:hypothetical protein